MARTHRTDGRGRRVRQTGRAPFPNECPRHWRKVHMTRPRRRVEKGLCRRVIGGASDQVWPLGNRRPHEYFW